MNLNNLVSNLLSTQKPVSQNSPKSKPAPKVNRQVVARFNLEFGHKGRYSVRQIGYNPEKNYFYDKGFPERTIPVNHVHYTPTEKDDNASDNQWGHIGQLSHAQTRSPLYQ
jgi:hypothetical protein